MPKMVPVVSSNLAEVGYEDGTLYIRFHSGGLYSYSNVPPAVFLGLMNAPSLGKYFHANIRNVYRYQKL